MGRTPWSAADAHVGPALVAAMLFAATNIIAPESKETCLIC
jgi:hypothetical protein